MRPCASPRRPKYLEEVAEAFNLISLKQKGGIADYHLRPTPQDAKIVLVTTETEFDRRYDFRSAANPWLTPGVALIIRVTFTTITGNRLQSGVRQTATMKRAEDLFNGPHRNLQERGKPLS